jgi:hypothetical protein
MLWKILAYSFDKDGPVHRRFGVLYKRLDTYKRFDPTNHPIGIKKLTEAGFFYEGPSDMVRCFWCDGGMKDWEKGDNAWIEHAK